MTPAKSGLMDGVRATGVRRMGRPLVRRGALVPVPGASARGIGPHSFHAHDRLPGAPGVTMTCAPWWEARYTTGMKPTSGPTTDARILEALRRQVEDEEDHDLGLIEECLRLTPDERLERLAAWVDLIATSRLVERSSG